MQNNLFYYSSNFESTVITQPSIDGWLCNLDHAYLNVDAPVGQEERLIVMGNNINNGAYQDFSVIPGYEYTVDYQLALNSSGTMTLKVNEGATTIATDNKTGNGSHNLIFFPTTSSVRIHFAGNVQFALNNIDLQYFNRDTIVAITPPRMAYRYGFQNQEKDEEVKGKGNSVNFEFRMHDPRIGRFFAVDPLTSKYPFYSPYAFSGNQLINAIEKDGLEPLNVNPPVRRMFYRQPSGRVVKTVIGYRSHMNVSFNRLSTSRGSLRSITSQSRVVDEFEVQPTPLRNGTQAVANWSTVKEEMEIRYKNSLGKLQGDVDIVETNYNSTLIYGNSNRTDIKFTNKNDEKIINDLEIEYNKKADLIIDKILKDQGYSRDKCMACSDLGNQMKAKSDAMIEEIPTKILVEAKKQVPLTLGISPKQKLISDVKASPATEKQTTYIKQDIITQGR